MRSVKFAVCDDDKKTRDYIRASILDKWKSQHSIMLFTDGAELIDYYLEGRPPIDIVLLDIYMNRLNGVETAHLLRKYDEQVIIIFLTSSRDHVFDGYDVQAFQYLVKPVQRNKLVSILESAMERVSHNEDFIVIQDGKEFRRLPIAQILYVAVNGKHVVFYLLFNKTVQANGPMVSVNPSRT